MRSTSIWTCLCNVCVCVCVRISCDSTSSTENFHLHTSAHHTTHIIDKRHAKIFLLYIIIHITNDICITTKQQQIYVYNSYKNSYESGRTNRERSSAYRFYTHPFSCSFSDLVSNGFHSECVLGGLELFCLCGSARGFFFTLFTLLRVDRQYICIKIYRYTRVQCLEDSRCMLNT